MSQRLNQLLNERASVWESMKALRDDAEKNEDKTFTADQRSSWDKHESRMSELTSDIEREQRASKYDDLEGAVTEVPSQRSEDTRSDEPSSEQRYDSAFQNYVRHGLDALDGEQRKMLRENAYVQGGEGRALSIGTNTAGGYTVPPGFRDTLIETMKQFGNVRAVATLLPTASGQPLQWPTSDTTAQVGAILAENSQMAQLDPAFGTATLGAYMYTSKLVLVPFQLLQDSVIDVQSFLARKLGERIARIQNQHFTTGTGSSQPLGIVTNAATGYTMPTGNTTSITYDGLVQLIHSIDPAYRQSPNVKFMLPDSALIPIRLLKDTQGHPLWQPSLQAGVPDSILGYNYVINNDMAAPTANGKSVLFGDFNRGYVIRDVLDVQVRRLDERYADYLQVGWFGFARADATQQDASAYKALVQSAT